MVADAGTAGVGSLTPEVRVTVLVTASPAKVAGIRPTTITIADSPDASDATVQLTPEPVAVQESSLASRSTSTPAGIASSSTIPVAVDGPRLLTRIDQLAVPPATNSSWVACLTRSRSACWSTV